MNGQLHYISEELIAVVVLLGLIFGLLTAESWGRWGRRK